MPLNAHQENEVHKALFAGKKIVAIKHYREATGCGLKDAKEAVEALEVALRNKDPHRFEKAEVKGGCFGMLVLFAVLVAIAVISVR